MIALTDAAENIGAKVVYRAPHVKRHEKGEEGVITSVGSIYVFVRYGADMTAKATSPALLDWVKP